MMIWPGFAATHVARMREAAIGTRTSRYTCTYCPDVHWRGTSPTDPPCLCGRPGILITADVSSPAETYVYRR
jgi:hypothetical protein